MHLETILTKRRLKTTFDIILTQRIEKTWTHYDIECVDKQGRCIKIHNSEHCGAYKPPYPAHFIEKGFNGKIELNRIYKRLFAYDACGNYYLDYPYEVKAEIENVFLKNANGRKMKFELIK